MTRIEKLNKIQEEAIQKWVASSYVGLINVFTGGGKNFIAWKALYKLKESNLLDSNDLVWFLAETNARELTIKVESDKFEKIYGKNPLKDFNIQFHCYQAQPQGDPKMIIYDEAHETTSPTRLYLLQKDVPYKLGLSAFIQENTNVFRDKLEWEQLNKVYQSDKAVADKRITDFITKGQLLEMYCPIVYSYSAEKARETGLLNTFKTIVIEHQLDNTKKNIQITKNWKGTEQDYWNFWWNFSNDYTKPKGFRMVIKKQRLPKFLYNLPSKAIVAKKLLEKIGDKKTIVFGVEGIDGILKEITPNVAAGKHSDQLVEDFNAGKINTIATSKKLVQGITLDGLERVLIVSFYSTPSDLIQRLGKYLLK